MSAVLRRQQASSAMRFSGTALLAAICGLLVALMPLATAFYVVSGCLLLGLAFMDPANALLLLLLVAPLKALIETEAPGLLPFDPGQLGLLIMIASWIVRDAVGRRSFRLPVSAIHVPVGVFLLATVASLGGALSVFQASTEILKWLQLAIMISICVAVFQTRPTRWLVFTLVLAGSVQAIVGIYQFFGGSGADHLRILDGTHFRAFGSFGQPNPFGAFMGMTLPLAIMSIWGYLHRLWDMRHALSHSQRADAYPDVINTLGWLIFYGSAGALIVAGLVFSWSRGAWMGAGASLVVMLFLIPKKSLRRIMLTLAAIALFIGAWSQGIIPTAIASRMVGFVDELTTITDVRGVYITDENYAVTERIAHWQVAQWIAEDYPWTGAGFGNYAVAYPQYALLAWQNPLGHAHNYYLNLLAEVGIVGLSAYIIMWLGIVGLTLQTWRCTQGFERAWVIGLAGVWVYIAVHSLVDKLFVNNMHLQIGSMLGLLAVIRAGDNRISQ